MVHSSLMPSTHPKEAFILSGGKGERLRPLTDKTPKTLLEVQGKSVLEWNIQNVLNHGVKKIILGLGVKTNVIQKFIEKKEFDAEIIFSAEKTPLGTAGALKLAEEFIKTRNFVMCNGDEVKNIDYSSMHSLQTKKSAGATLALLEVENAQGFGLVDFDKKSNSVSSFKEKPDKPVKGVISAGAYVLNRKVFGLIPPEENFSIEKSVFPVFAKEQKLFGLIIAGGWFPIDTPEKLESAGKNWKGF